MTRSEHDALKFKPLVCCAFHDPLVYLHFACVGLWSWLWLPRVTDVESKAEEGERESKTSETADAAAASALPPASVTQLLEYVRTG